MPAHMPKIMYGTAWKQGRTADLVYQAVKAGFRGIDTACQPKHYREDLVGAGLKRAFEEGLVKREDVFIQTKYTSIDGQDTSQPLPYDSRSPIAEQVKQSFQKSLSNLGVEYIDSVVLHSPLRTRQATLEAYRALEEYVDTGKLLALGVSNCYDPKTLDWLITEARIKVSVVQNRWYEGNGFDWGVYDLCQKHSIRYQSFWTLTGNPTLLGTPALLALAEQASLTPEQAVYKLCQTWNITPICGSTTLSHVEEAISVEEADGVIKDNEHHWSVSTRRSEYVSAARLKGRESMKGEQRAERSEVLVSLVAPALSYQLLVHKNMPAANDSPPVSAAPPSSPVTPELADFFTHLERHLARTSAQVSQPAQPEQVLLHPFAPPSHSTLKADKKPRIPSPRMKALKVTNLPPRDQAVAFLACPVPNRIEIYTTPKPSKRAVFRHLRLSSGRRKAKRADTPIDKPTDTPTTEPAIPVSAHTVDTFSGSRDDDTDGDVTMVEEEVPRERLAYLGPEEEQQTVAFVHFRSEYHMFMAYDKLRRMTIDERRIGVYMKRWNSGPLRRAWVKLSGGR